MDWQRQRACVRSGDLGVSALGEIPGLCSAGIAWRSTAYPDLGWKDWEKAGDAEEIVVRTVPREVFGIVTTDECS